MPPKKFYAVKQGRFGPKIYLTWAECSNAVTGYPNAKFKGFTTEAEAKKYVANSNNASIINNIKDGVRGSQPAAPVLLPPLIPTTKSVTDVVPKNLTEHIIIPINRAQEPAKTLLEIDITAYIQYFDGIEKYDKIEIYTDGGCTNSGTPSALACSGCYFPQFGVGLSVGVPKEQTNNRGELWATIYAIYFVMHLLNDVGSHVDGVKWINIYTDSTYVEKNLINKGVKNLDLCDILKLANESNRIPFRLFKVPGHANNQGNNIADYLAKTSHLQA